MTSYVFMIWEIITIVHIFEGVCAIISESISVCIFASISDSIQKCRSDSISASNMVAKIGSGVLFVLASAGLMSTSASIS